MNYLYIPHDTINMLRNALYSNSISLWPKKKLTELENMFIIKNHFLSQNRDI
jgi:hypothetical protein